MATETEALAGQELPPPRIRTIASRASLRAANAVLPRAARALRLPDDRRQPHPGAEILQAHTNDGVELVIERIRPTVERRGAVILQHGLSGNGAPFDLPGRSIARHLAAAGLECFIPDLRGARYSARPRRPWSIDEYVEHDVPSILEAVLSATGDASVSWVGHSLGGLLLFFHVIENEDAPIHRAVTIGTAIDYRPGRTMYRDLRDLLPLAKGLSYLPYGYLARLLAPLAGKGPLLLPEKINFYRHNVEPEIAAAVLREFHHIPVQLFHGLDTAFSEHGFHRREGTIRYLEEARRYRIPTLFIGGSRDPHCSTEAVEETGRLLGGHAESKTLLLGREYGQSEDYGHFDLILGKRAPEEVWPVITEWLLA